MAYPVQRNRASLQRVRQTAMGVIKILLKFGTGFEIKQMPLKRIEKSDEGSWALWKIEEEEEALINSIRDIEQIPAALTHIRKRLEWAAGRRLVKTLMDALGITFQGVTKNEFGKPFPLGCGYQLSLSHSFPYVAAYLHPHASVGIDLEQPSPKLLKIAHRIHSPDELKDVGNDVRKHCLYWCAKEVMVKVYGKKDLIFTENLKINPFFLGERGEISGRIVVNTKETSIPMYYEAQPDFIVVLNKP